jgi:hypothetical protein
MTWVRSFELSHGLQVRIPIIVAGCILDEAALAIDIGKVSATEWLAAARL